MDTYIKACDRLPYEVVLQIVEYMNIGYITITLNIVGKHLNKELKEKIKDIRLDPKLYLLQLTDNPLALLTLMRQTKTILSGSRAVNYFVPGSCEKNSDWDFYCEDSTHSVIPFKIWFTFLGANWEPKDSIDYQRDDFYEQAKFQLIRGTIKNRNKIHKIQIMWRVGKTATQCVIGFHSTAPQCFISGFVAVSMYHKLTSNNKSLSWQLNDTPEDNEDEVVETLIYDTHSVEDSDSINDIEDLDIEDPVLNMEDPSLNMHLDTYRLRNRISANKYRKKGFKYIHYYNCFDYSIGSRYLLDKNCCAVQFNKYLNTETWNISYDQYIRTLKHVRWYDVDSITGEDTAYINLYARRFKLFSIRFVTTLEEFFLPGNLPEEVDKVQSFHTTLNTESNNSFTPLTILDITNIGEELKIPLHITYNGKKYCQYLPC